LTIPTSSSSSSLAEKGVSAVELRSFVNGLPVEEAVRERLRALKVADYVGLATRICDEVVAHARKELAP